MSAPAPTASASYAAEVTRLLWPEPWEAPRMTRSRRRGPAGPGTRDVYLFPAAAGRACWCPPTCPAPR